MIAMAIASALLSACAAGSGQSPQATQTSSVVAVAPSGSGGGIQFTCPKDGVVAESIYGQTTYHGAEPGDPVLCVRTSVRGQQQKFLYNFYSNTTEIRQGMGDFMSGRVQSVKFRLHRDGRDWDDTWTRLGVEDTIIGTYRFKATIFEREQKQTTGTFHGKWKIWFDPETGLWPKQTYTAIQGSYPQFANSELTNVILP
jgi:hypothetical protein